jgi:hypothetical protein
LKEYDGFWVLIFVIFTVIISATFKETLAKLHKMTWLKPESMEI